MRIALLAPAPFDTISGGYGYDRRIVAGLRQAGHDVSVIELAGRHPLSDASAAVSAKEAWNSVPLDAVPVIDGLALPAFLPLRDGIAARRTIGLIHHPTARETGQQESDRARLRDAEQCLFPLLARVVVTSEPTAQCLADDFAVPRDHIAVVVPGTDDAVRSHGSGRRGCTILSVGTVVPRKGHDTLLRALARMPDLDWQLVIAGDTSRDPAHVRRLQDLAAELGIEGRVKLVGVAADDALEELWQTADIFALATHWEGYGMAIAEALKRGLPVAITAGGAAGALVSPEAGVACAPGDHEGLSKAMRRLIFDTGLRRGMADAAWKAGQALPSWPAQVDAFIRAIA